MKIDFSKLTKLALKTPILVGFLLVFALGYMAKGVVSSSPRSDSVAAGGDEVQEEVWTCSMHPEIRLPGPGKCPKCGMELILAATTAKGEKTPQTKKYACSMMCVPPLPLPGDCPICGMEMVEIEDDGGGGDENERTLTLSPAAQKLAEIEVAPVERRFVDVDIRMVGKVDYDETRMKYITAWVPGRLDRLYVDYTGVPVKEGDHLVYMYSPELLVAQVELLRAIKTAKEFGSNVSEGVRHSANTMVEDSRKKLRLWGLSNNQISEIEERGTPSDHMTIFAPLGGIVIHKNATEGMYVDTGSRIYTIADLSHLWVRLDAYESDLAWLRYAQKVEFETEAYPGETFTGTVAFIDPVLDSRTRTVKIRVNVDNADGRLKPQMFVRARVTAKLAEGGLIVNTALAGKWISPMHPEVIKDEPGVCDVCGMPLVRAETLGFVSPDDVNARPPLVVPATAPLMTGKRAVVYVPVQGKNGTYEGRMIVPGSRAGDFYIVKEGLTESESVVVNGNFKIDSAIQIRAKPSMMNPGQGETPTTTHEQHGSDEGTPAEPGQTRNKFEIPSEFSTKLGRLFSTYTRVQTALSLDSDNDAKKAAKEFCKALEGLDMSLLEGDAHLVWMKEVKGIKKTATELIATPDINATRSAFALLSESMIAVAKKFGTGGQAVHRFHCPMAFNNRGADWLQKDPQTANPYFGSTMFRCGALKETFESAPTDLPMGGNGDN